MQRNRWSGTGAAASAIAAACGGVYATACGDELCGGSRRCTSAHADNRSSASAPAPSVGELDPELDDVDPIVVVELEESTCCLLYTSPSPRDS